MTGTTAVPSDVLEQAAMQGPGGGNPLCPACVGGRLHPYKVEFSLGPPGYQGAIGLTGWVAVCKGNIPHRRRIAEAGLEDWETGDQEPCGFSMPLTQIPRQVSR